MFIADSKVMCHTIANIHTDTVPVLRIAHTDKVIAADCTPKKQAGLHYPFIVCVSKTN